MQALNRFLLFLVVGCLFLFCSAGAFAAPTLTISSSDGKGTFLLTGKDFQVVGGAKVTIRYDTSTLANPRVTAGSLASGTVFLPRTTTPGTIVLGVVAPNGISGSGMVATIAFDVTGSSPGVIQALIPDEVIDLNGRAVAIRAQVINPTPTSSPESPETAPTAGTGDTTSPSGTTDQPTAAAETGPTAARAATVGGLPAQLQQEGSTAPTADGDSGGEKAQTEPRADSDRDTKSSEQPAVTTEQRPEALASEPALPSPAAVTGMDGTKNQPEHVAFKSVLEQFRLVGTGTPKSLLDIFSRHTMPGISQEPAIALTDGTSKLRLSVTLQSPGKGAPSFTLKNAELVSLKSGSDGSWLIEALPAKGSYSATVAVLQDGRETEIPLLVAPPLPSGIAGGKSGKLTETDFAKFLADRGTQKAPRFDLNGDGRRDYIDDYIFTANYLARKETGPGKHDSRKALTVGGRGSHSGEGTGKAK